jgi:hypothetical protein
MLQLSKNKALNTFAIYPNVLPTNGSGLYIVYSQSYDESNGTLQAVVISNSQNTSWVIAQISGSVLPSASGQYVFDTYELLASGSAVWNTFNQEWELAATTWGNATFFDIGDLISTDRAFISGSDVVPITQYISPNENATYITYLG